MASAAEEMPELMTVSEVAARMRVEDRTVREWISAGLLGATKIGRTLRIPRGEFEALLERHRTNSDDFHSGGLWDRGQTTGA